MQGEQTVWKEFVVYSILGFLKYLFYCVLFCSEDNITITIDILAQKTGESEKKKYISNSEPKNEH